MRAWGGEVRSFGIMTVMGIVRHFYIDKNGVKQLDRHGQLWSFVAPIMARLWFFAGGMILWAVHRQSGTWLPSILLLISQIALLMFLILQCMPLLHGDGYRWMATYIGQPNLKRKAIATLRAKMKGRPIPASVRRDEIPGLLSSRSPPARHGGRRPVRPDRRVHRAGQGVSGSSAAHFPRALRVLHSLDDGGPLDGEAQAGGTDEPAGA